MSTIVVSNRDDKPAGRTNPPFFRVESPTNGTLISGSQFDIRGPCDDPAAGVTALICDDQGNTSRINGVVESNGCLWVERIPLAEGITHVTIVTMDAAGNSCLTNITVGKSKDTLSMDPVADPQQLRQPRITITGYYSGTNHSVSVNGVEAKVKPGGHWMAENVPVKSPNGGTATFDITADDDEKLTPSHVWTPAVLSQPVNSLQAGVSMEPASTNEYNHYTIYLGVTNISATNQPRKWMLPAADKRFDLRLLDKKGAVVATTEDSPNSGNSLPDSLNIHHLGQGALANIDGIIPLDANAAVQLAKLNLDEFLTMPPPGKYRMEVEERLYQIGDDGRLLPVLFPTMVMELKVIDQPSAMIFHLNNLTRQGKLHWGLAMDSMRVGVMQTDSGERGDGKQMMFEVVLENLGKDDIHFMRLPRLEEQYETSLTGPNGEAVARTALGQKRGLPLEVKDDASDFFVGGPKPTRTRSLFLRARDATSLESFNLSDLFEIKAPGKYSLKLKQRLYQIVPTIRPAPFIMPEVVVPVDVKTPP